jgi:6-phosphogluconolactonase/glucosamine-6-phosphate isomerase/deaminase
LTQLNLYDTGGTAGKVINEMLVSLLQCQQVTDTDSLNLHSVALSNNYTFPYEDSDSCYKRLQQNWLEMKKAFHPKYYIINYNAYWDKRNNRVYQFDFKNFSRKQKLEFTIKNYRLDCVYQMLNL